MLSYIGICMKRALSNLIIFLVNFALIYVCIFAGVFADFLFLGKGASVNSGEPVFAKVFGCIQLFALTILFLRKKWGFHIAVYIVSVALLIGLTYYHIFAKL